MTNLRLQKILFFAHATYYHQEHRRLFDDPVAAWPLGPVIPSVYYRVKELAANGTEPIQCLLKECTADGIVTTPEIPRHDTDSVSHMEDVWKLFEPMSTAAIVQISHSPKGAWYKTLWEKGINPNDPDLRYIIPRNLTILDCDIESCGR